MKNEKRKYPRVKVKCPVVLMTSQGSLYGEVRNLSRGGALIRTSKFTKPLSSFPAVVSYRKKSFTAMAELVWSGNFFEEKLISHGMGVRFTYIFAHGRETIEDIIHDHFIEKRKEKSSDQPRP
jgi:hypothetical protein